MFVAAIPVVVCIAAVVPTSFIPIVKLFADVSKTLILLKVGMKLLNQLSLILTASAFNAACPLKYL